MSQGTSNDASESIVPNSWYDHEDHPEYTVIPRFVDDDGQVGYEVYDRHGDGAGKHVHIEGCFQDVEAFREAVEPADIVVHVEPVEIEPKAIDP